MDNRGRSLKLFGTPLSKSLTDEPHASDRGPINSRRAKIEERQTVRDAQGRRRFHGAFTGGYSAGYYGTVGSAQGFRPKSFSTHRGGRIQNDDSSKPASFDHRPEDYMDDEDFEEFGIAPKKVRIANQYSSDHHAAQGRGQTNRSGRAQLVIRESIGERILRSMSGDRVAKNLPESQPVRQKIDFHGLGYKPLVPRTAERSSQSTLVASLDQGRRLKIDGHAFGDGILDEDDDDVYGANEYGYDDLGNYEFRASRPTTATKISESSKRHGTSPSLDRYLLDGFELVDNLKTLELTDDYFPIPVIEDGWKSPRRTKPITDSSRESESNRQNLSVYHGQSGSFSAKFTGSTSLQARRDMEFERHAGLVSYSDLKAIETKSRPYKEEEEGLECSGISIKRSEQEWRPSNLLCKHFEVPNPYPGEVELGVKPSSFSLTSDGYEPGPAVSSGCLSGDRVASIELRRSIFNVTFDDETTEYLESERESDEDQPQVVELDLETKAGFNDKPDYCGADHEFDKRDHESDRDSDIVLVKVSRPEPEVIVLSSSASNSSRADGDDKEDSGDGYGPPLPPSREILHGFDRHASRSLHHSTSRPSSKLSRRAHKRAKMKKKSRKSRSDSKIDLPIDQ